MKFRKIGNYAVQCRVLIGGIMLLSICAAAIAALSPWPLKLLVDYAFTGTTLPSDFATLNESFPWLTTPMGLAAAAAAACFAIFLANSIVQLALEWNWAVLGQRLIRQVAADLFSKLQRLSLGYHSRQPVGDSLNRIAGDAWCINNIILSVFTAPVQHLFTLATIGLIAWNMDAGLTLIMLVTAPALGASTWFFSGRLKNRALLNRQAQSQVMNFVHQTLTSIPVVQAFGTENQNRNRFDQLASNLVLRSQRDQVMREAFSLTNGISLTAGAAIIIYAGGERVLAGGLTLGSLLVFIAYMKSLQSASEALLRAYGNIKSWEASWYRVLEVL
jgi:ATP-binding cassette subfamily B protein